MPIVLPARMSLIPEAIANLEIAVFDFPYTEAIDEFLAGLKRILGDGLEIWQYPPYRLLNSAIVACAPTVVHGFEKYSHDGTNVRRMLAVGQPIYDHAGSVIGSTLRYPSEEQIAQLIRVWIQVWGQQVWLRRLIERDARDLWRNLEQALDTPPPTQWRRINPEQFITHLSAEGGLGYKAIPSLLATLLHNQRSTIGSQATEIQWRKAQDSPDRLCIVSNPLPISFTRKTRFNVQERDGFFAYKLEFQIQTQTGRPQPWVHVFLRCQRYVHLPLTRNTRGSDITLLVGMNQARVDGWDSDTTLVRLKANRTIRERATWLDSLPVLLANFGARSLATPSEIYRDPQAFWKSEEASVNDEYYVIHAEGYQYSRRKHPVMTGFGLAERSEIIDETCCTLLRNVLQPDTFLEPDTPIFTQEPPRALWTFSDLAEPPKPLTKAQARKQGIPESQIAQHQEQENQRQRRERQSIPVEAIQRAVRGKELLILIVYRTEDTREALHQQLRVAFLLNEGDTFPSNVIVSDHPILADKLWQPLDSGSSPAIRNTPRSLRPSDCPDNFDRQWNTKIRRAHSQKMQAWQDFLRQVKRSAIQGELNENNFCLTALIELPEETVGDEFHESQSIKGAVREACAREKILSQMIHSVSWTTNRQTVERILPSKEKGRTQNAVQEIVNRQIGALYGTVSDVYQQIGFPEDIAKQLDVIALCLKTTQVGVRYGCAVRLSAGGQIDVLLPELNPQWYPYAEVGTQVGRIFAAARSDISRNGRIDDRSQSQIRLSQGALVQFVEDTLTNRLERPTVMLIEAENWRNKGVWTQLKNEPLAQMLDRLEFVEDRQQSRVYLREDAQLSHLLAVIRIRSGDETPQYITNRETWQEDALSRDLQELSGFVDRTINGTFHYFSIGRLPKTITNSQAKKRTEDPYKIEDGGGIAFKHQQMLELIPFFVHPDFQNEEGLKILCRVPHYLRSSPAWSVGNILLSYPMRLGKQLIEDQICILGTHD